MKKAIHQLSIAILFLCLYMGSQAQTAQSSVTDQKRIAEIKRATTMIEKIATTVKITEEQKTRLQSSLQNCFKNFDDGQAAVKNDDNKVHALRTELQESLLASIKSILTPEQYSVVLDNPGK